MNSTRTKEVHCPDCKHRIDAASPADGQAIPKKGDISICLYCLTVLEFTTEELDVDVLSVETLASMSVEQVVEIIRIRRRMLEVKTGLN